MGINFVQKTFSSLKHENFRLFFTGQAISLVGSWMQITAMSWLIYDLTNSKLLLGLIGALSALPMLFLSVLGGVFADKYPKRKLLLVTQSISMILAAVLAVLVITKTITVWHIVLIATLSGISFAIDMPVRQSFYIEIVGKNDLMNAIALNSSMVNLARIIGPALAGIIMVKFSLAWCFILNSISFLAVLIALFKLKLPEFQIKKKVESIMKYTMDGFNYVFHDKSIFYLLVLMTILGIFGWSYGILFPVIAKDIFHVSEKGYAAMVSANGVGSLIGALFVAYLGNSSKKKHLINWGVLTFAAAMILLAICKVYWLSLLCIALAGTGLVIYFNATTTLIQSSVNDSVRGRVMGIWALVFGGTTPLGNLFTGICAEYGGIAFTLILSAILCALAVIILPFFIQYERSPDIQEESLNA